MDRKFIKRWSPLLLIALLISVVWASGLMDMVRLEVIKEQRGVLLDMVGAYPVLGVLGFVVLYVVVVALSLPIALMMTLVGGLLFGRWLGTVAIVIGATAGATILFLVARSTLGAVLCKKAEPLYDKIAANMKQNAVGYMLFMRLVPLFPFFLVNIVPALFKVRLRPYLITTFFGIMLGTFVYANVGRELGRIDSLADLVSPQSLIAIGLLGVIALVPVFYKQVKSRKKSLGVLLTAALLLSSQGAYAGEGYTRFLTLYDGLLRSHVMPVERNGVAYNGVDYDGWAQDTRHEDALALLLAENPEEYISEATKKAFWINAYNLLSIALILREDERESIKNIGGLFTSPWKKHTWAIKGRDYTLDQIEHKILRPMGDARIHFAINCAAVSCPDLRAESYRAQKLELQLNEQVMITLSNEGKGIRQDNERLYVSKIFKWFAADFNRGDIQGWINSYTPLDTAYDLRFMAYHWSLNLQPKTHPDKGD